MNALISAFKDKQKIMFANEGRLLKKSFFGLLILALAFQTGDFGDVIRESMVNAYLAVSVFVGFTLIVFIGLDSFTNFDIGSFLDKTKKLHVPIASFLGAIPGCGGAIIVVTQYIQGRISFGSLVAVLTVGIGGGIYLVANLGPGPRDGLMIGLQKVSNLPIAAVRAFIEISVVSVGWYLGGTVGIGTLLFAFGIGPAVALGLYLVDKVFNS